MRLSFGAFLRHKAPMKRSIPFNDEDLTDPTGEEKPWLLRSNDAEEIRRWIKYVCRVTGLAPTKLAKGAGIASSTINKFLYDQSYKFTPSSNTLEKIRRFANSEIKSSACDEAAIYSTAKEYVKNTEDKEKNDNNEEKKKSDGWLAMFEPVVVRGRIGAYENGDNMFFDGSKRYMISVPPSPSYPGIVRFGLEVNDDSMNSVYKRGSIIVCVSGYDTDKNFEELRDGTRIVVEYGKSGEIRSRSLREIVRDQSGDIWLMHRSTEPRLFGGTKLEHMKNHRLYAIVVGSYIPE